MTLLNRRTLRRKVIPALAMLVVAVALIASFEASLQAPNQAFAFGTYWPAPTSYNSKNPLPNVYLAINYTGHGMRNYTYTILFDNSSVLTTGTVPVGHGSPFRLLVFSPVPAVLQARVVEEGRLVFVQDLALG